MIITLSLLRERLLIKNWEVSDVMGEDAEIRAILLIPSGDLHTACLYQIDSGVCLVCGRGSILIQNITTETAFDAVQSAMAFYREWELSLVYAVWNGASVQELIDLAEPVFRNPIFVCTWQGKLLGYTKKYDNDTIREFWSILVRDKQVPIYCLKNLRESSFYDVVSMENSSQLLSFSDYGHRCIMGMIHRNHEICLHYQIIEHDTKLTDAMVQLSQLFLAVLQKTVAAEQDANVFSTSQILMSLLEGKNTDKTNIEWMETSLGWAGNNGAYRLLCFRQFEKKGRKKDRNYLFGQLEIRLPLSKIIYWNDDAISITSMDTLSQSMDDVKLLCEALNCACGISLPFFEWTDLNAAYEQSNIAVSFCSVNEKIVECERCALEYLTKRLCENAESKYLLHPVAKILSDYDAKHDSDFVNTLLSYIENERNISVSADVLFIHRNTMQYRMKKIFELINVNLNDPDIRFHIYLSLKSVQKFKV